MIDEARTNVRLLDGFLNWGQGMSDGSKLCEKEGSKERNETSQIRIQGLGTFIDC